MSTNNIFYYLIFLISISFSISVVPKEIKYFLFGLLMIHVIYSFLKSHLYINFNQILLLIVICLYPIFITLFNDIFRQFNEPFGYLTLVQSLIIFLNLLTFFFNSLFNNSKEGINLFFVSIAIAICIAVGNTSFVD